MFERILKLALEAKRPDHSPAIQDLCHALRDIQPGLGFQDAAGNLWADLRAGAASTCFMAHLDTVHESTGPNRVLWTDGRAHTGGRSVLGADDGAGVAVLAGLMAAGVPALYLFTQGEETGARGARYVKDHHARAFAGIQRIISFDRRGRQDICGEQRGGICASRAFVAELAGRLAMGHQWAVGHYTDNSEFRELVPEIVNLSAGYAQAHSDGECLDLVYLRSLMEKCLVMDWETLGVRRGIPGPGQPRVPLDLWEEESGWEN